MHRVLSELACAHRVLLWNASMLFAPDNRNPSPSEVEACAPVLELVCRGRAVFAIGRFAQSATDAPYIRHPSHGGAGRFAEGLRVGPARRHRSMFAGRWTGWMCRHQNARPGTVGKAQVGADGDRRLTAFTLQP